MKNNYSYITAIGAHALIGIIIYLNETTAKVYFLAAIVYFLYRIIVMPADQKTVEVLKACAYFVGAEVLFRMTRGAFSYEAGKYLVIAFVLFGMLYKGLSGKGYPYFIYLMFLIPSIFVASTTLSFDANFRTNIAFVLSGPVCLGLAALFCYDKRITFEQMSEVLLFMLLPIISHVAYIYFYSPDLKEVLSSTGSNRAASGGFGPNQVAAILGLGMFLVTIRLFIKSSTFQLKIINSLLLILISYRAVVTFSRGGVIAAIMAIIFFIIYYYGKATVKKKNEVIGVLILLCISLSAAWVISSSQSSGLIDLRYTNKDVLGREKGDITTGRGILFEKELEGFISNPFFGIGSSRAKDQRIEIEGQGVASHSEVSRVLAEHGIFGVVILIILIFKPLDIRTNNRQNYYFYAFMVFWFATINHMSMRIAMPSFIYALALLNVTHDKHPIYRKQLKK